MELYQIRPQMRVEVMRMPDCAIKKRLRQFGFLEGTVVQCRYARRNLVALEWMGTAIAVRRKDLVGIQARVIAWN